MSDKLVIKNVGLMLSGDLARPILDADTIVAVDGRIAEVGKAGEATPQAPVGRSTPRAQPWRRA
jgi:hypothetical protein